jgi:hypothetical protein
MSPGTTGTHTHFQVACSLGMPSVHHVSVCISPHNPGGSTPQKVMDGLQAHANTMGLSELAYECALG